MTTSYEQFTEGDVIRVASIDHRSLQGRDPHPEDELVGTFGTVVEVLDLEEDEPELERALARVRLAGRDELDELPFIVLATWEVEPVRKARYDVGDEVELYGDADGENGPHPSDLDQPRRFARVLEVETHPANPEWVTGYVVEEDGSRVAVRSIARLAREEDR
jgi:hypothetical protein